MRPEIPRHRVDLRFRSQHFAGDTDRCRTSTSRNFLPFRLFRHLVEARDNDVPFVNEPISGRTGTHPRQINSPSRLRLVFIRGTHSLRSAHWRLLSRRITGHHHRLQSQRHTFRNGTESLCSAFPVRFSKPRYAFHGPIEFFACVSRLLHSKHFRQPHRSRRRRNQ